MEEAPTMRPIVFLVLAGFLAEAGCGGSHQEVRVNSSMVEGSTQQKLDNVAASVWNGWLGGNR